MKFPISLLLILVLFSCVNDTIEIDDSNLELYIKSNKAIKEGGVIACAASSKETSDRVFIFYYPVPEAKEIKYFETSSTEIDKDDFSLYEKVTLPKEDVFNGYLERFVRDNGNEVWSVITYKVGETLHVSNPIRFKNKAKPTEWTSNVGINQSESKMPKFSWKDGSVKENVIYFQVITDVLNNLLSGTYTYEKQFQYYNLDNVVLNVTRETPPELIINGAYNFTLMGVSEDNWVNLVLQKEFKIDH